MPYKHSIIIDYYSLSDTSQICFNYTTADCNLYDDAAVYIIYIGRVDILSTPCERFTETA